MAGESIPAARQSARKMATPRCSRAPRFTISSTRLSSATLSASGIDVGLPEGQMGNSEVGHLNLGAGRIVYQDLTRINKAIAEGDLARNAVLAGCFRPGPQRDGSISSGSSPTAACIAISSICSRSRMPHRTRVLNDIFVHAIHRWPRHFTDRRRDFSTTCAEQLATERRANRHRDRSLFRDGSRQALGSDEARWDAIVLGRGEICQDIAFGRGRSAHYAPARPMSSCRR